MENTPGTGLCLTCLVLSPSLRPITPTPGPQALVISTELERESNSNLLERNVDFMWPQGKGWSVYCRGVWMAWLAQGPGGSRLHPGG